MPQPDVPAAGSTVAQLGEDALVRAVVGSGLRLVDLVEPGWREDGDHVWGGWSRLRGELIPGTIILVCERPR